MPSFSVTWDYRCPFARNAHEHVVAALEGGAPWDVAFLPFSLDQVHVEPGHQRVWDRPPPALLALQVGVVVRDRFPEAFLPVHVGLFSARHDEGHKLTDEAVLRSVLEDHGVSGHAVFAEIADGWPLQRARRDHEWSAREHQAFGVPTFITDGRAVFVRLLHRPEGDADMARRTVERVLDLAEEWPELNELKHTSVPR